MNNINWIFFDIGSTLVDESECYEIRYKETTESTNVSYQELGLKTIWVKQGFAKYRPKSDVPYYTVQMLEEIISII